MADPDAGDPRSGRWRVAVLAVVFALVSHGCLMMATSLTRSPF
jgi:hypothetical protein